MSIAPKDLKALVLLTTHRRGLYCSELVALSGGFIKRGTVYTLLDRLRVRGYVQATEEPGTASYNKARTRYRMARKGSDAVTKFLAGMGLEIAS